MSNLAFAVMLFVIAVLFCALAISAVNTGAVFGYSILGAMAVTTAIALLT